MLHLPGRDAVQKKDSLEVFLYRLLTGPQILHHQVCSVCHAGGNVVGISDITETADGKSFSKTSVSNIERTVQLPRMTLPSRWRTALAYHFPDAERQPVFA